MHDRINRSATESIPQDVIDIINDLGIPANVRGYDYLAYGIQYMRDNLEKCPSFTKELYPAVADAYGTTSTRVERAMRTAVEKIFNNQDYTKIIEYLGKDTLNDFHITNSNFLYKVARFIRRKSIQYS